MSTQVLLTRKEWNGFFLHLLSGVLANVVGALFFKLSVNGTIIRPGLSPSMPGSPAEGLLPRSTGSAAAARQ